MVNPNVSILSDLLKFLVLLKFSNEFIHSSDRFIFSLYIICFHASRIHLLLTLYNATSIPSVRISVRENDTSIFVIKFASSRVATGTSGIKETLHNLLTSISSYARI